MSKEKITNHLPFGLSDQRDQSFGDMLLMIEQEDH